MREKDRKKPKGFVISIGKKRFRIDTVKFAAIVLAIIAAIVVSKGIFFIKDAFTKEEVAVPYMLGMTYEEAAAKLEEVGLLCQPLEEADALFSDEYAEGEVMNVDPGADTIVKEGYTVKLTISKGQDEDAAPYVVNKLLGEATSLIKDKGFEVGEVTKEKSTLPIDVVIKQTPEGGTEMAKGGKIDLVISEGNEIKKTIVPDVIAKNIDEAKKAFEKANLSITSTDYDYNNNYVLNQVFYQSIAGGTEVDEGTGIILKISKGAGAVTSEEKTFGFTLDYSDAENSVFTVRVYKTQNGTRDLVHEGVHSKSNSGESLSVKGTGQAKISIYYDDKLITEMTVDFEKGQTID